MDRRAIARDGRRAQALDALQFERDRENALREQVAEIVLELDGRHVDTDAFARLSAEDVGRVRDALGLVGDDPSVDFEEEAETDEDELRRLEAEIGECRARQSALERYVHALEEESPERRA